MKVIKGQPLSLPKFKRNLTTTNTAANMDGTGVQALKVFTKEMMTFDWTGRLIRDVGLSFPGDPETALPLYKARTINGAMAKVPRLVTINNAGSFQSTVDDMLAAGLQAYLDRNAIVLQQADGFRIGEFPTVGGVNQMNAEEFSHFVSMGLPVMSFTGPVTLTQLWQTISNPPPAPFQTFLPGAASGKIAGGELLCLTLQPADDFLLFAAANAPLDYGTIDDAELAVYNAVKGDFAKIKMVFWHFDVGAGFDPGVLAAQQGSVNRLTGADTQLIDAGSDTAANVIAVIQSMETIIRSFFGGS